MSDATAEPVQVAVPPAVGRDRMVAVWIAATTISWFGDALWTVALAVTAVQTLSPALAGVVLGLATLPQAVTVLLGGVIADRYDTRRVLVAGQVGQAAVMLLGAAAWTAGLRGAPMLMTIALVFGITTGLTVPAGMTLARQLVRSEDLAKVMGWNQVANRTARLLGAPVGGVLVAWQGLSAAMAVNALSFMIVATALTLAVRVRFLLPRTTGEPWLGSLAGGVGYLKREPSARLLVVALVGLNVFVTPVVALGVALRVDASAWGSVWVGVAEAALAAGAIAGSLLAIRRPPSRPARSALFVLVVEGAAVAVDARPVLVPAMAVIGLAAGLASVWLAGVFQRTVAASHLGRVSSILVLGDRTMVPLALPAFGALAAGTSLFVATGLFGLAMGLLCLGLATRPAIAKLT